MLDLGMDSEGGIEMTATPLSEGGIEMALLGAAAAAHPMVTSTSLVCTG